MFHLKILFMSLSEINYFYNIMFRNTRINIFISKIFILKHVLYLDRYINLICTNVDTYI
jgi:hypothetical protein